MHPDSAQLALKLHTELTELRQFRELLARETLILEAGKVDDLPLITERKGLLAARLGQLLQEREAVLTRMNLGSGLAGMTAWLATLPDPIRNENAQHWEKLLKLVGDCRREHELNGKLINLLMAENQKALAVLLSAGGQPLTYGPDGQQRIGPGTGRTLGSA